jgi:hypothetical protein
VGGWPATGAIHLSIHFPWFGTSSYGPEQVRALRDQMTAMQGDLLAAQDSCVAAQGDSAEDNYHRWLRTHHLVEAQIAALSHAGHQHHRWTRL